MKSLAAGNSSVDFLYVTINGDDTGGSITVKYAILLCSKALSWMFVSGRKAKP